jgi:Cu/Ag efflux protein CusF
MIIHRPVPLALAGVILFALPACAARPAATVAEPSAHSVGLDLGPSSRIPTMQLAMAGTGHDARLGADRAAAAPVVPVHNDGSDAHASGTVNKVDAAQHKINVSHTPIPAIGWPAMTMEFSVAPSVDLSRIKPGSRVDFSIEKGKDGMYEIRSLQPVGTAQ